MVGRVYSNQNSFNDSSVDRDTVGLSPIAKVSEPISKKQYIN